jgi:hypothetical protein
MYTSTGTIVMMLGVGLLAFTGRAEAAEPTRADFDACNREAQARTGSPSAAPSTERDTTAKPGTPVSPSAAPETKTPSPPPSGGSATKPGTPVSPSAAPSTDAPKTPPPPSTSDRLSRGMGQAGQTDPAFKQAYVDCMKRRGF